MSDLNLSAVVTGFVYVAMLLLKFDQDLVLPKWLTAFSLGGLLTVLMVILPWIQKGYFLAFMVGYALMGALLFNALVVLAIAHLPGLRVITLSANSAHAGELLLKFLGRGCSAIGQASVNFLRQGLQQLKALTIQSWSPKTANTAIVPAYRFSH